MLSVEQALEQVLTAALPTRHEVVPLLHAYGRVLAEAVTATEPTPRWDNSAMDGYAVIAADTTGSGTSTDCEAPVPDEAGRVFSVLETIAAGQVGRHRVGPGQCARIMTGAPLPPGADAVIMREHAEELPDGRVRLRGAAKSGQHVRRRGEELRPGTVVLHPGTVLNPGAVGVCASQGRTSVTVAARPRVAILSTGDEVVPPGQALGPGQIWSSNTHALVGLVRAAGGEAIDCGNAPDTLDGTRAAFERALDEAPDLLLSTGGVSVGDFDVVKEALGAVGAEMRFWKVRMKPGKPLAFGVIGGVPAFGLPGNPVSCMVNFLQFVRPVLRRALGDPNPYLPVVPARLDCALRKRPGRAELVRVCLRWDEQGLVADVTGPQGSGRVTSMALAHGLVLLGPDSEGAAAGSAVSVQIIDPGFLTGPAPAYRWG